MLHILRICILNFRKMANTTLKMILSKIIIRYESKNDLVKNLFWYQKTQIFMLTSNLLKRVQKDVRKVKSKKSWEKCKKGKNSTFA
jgi:hypothetical protein